MTCLNESTKEELIKVIDDTVSDTKEAQVLAEFIEGIQKCTTDDVPTGRKNKRPLSKYNLFISKCAKGTGVSFKDCIQRYRDMKKEKKGS